MSENNISEMSYEQAFEALQEVIGSLETGEKPLEEALALFERGQALYQRCNQLLDQAELRLQQLSESGELEDFVE
jgi:exodeoxyribonuclease VII small subunit